MISRKIIGFIILFFFLSGCATTTWIRDTKSTCGQEILNARLEVVSTPKRAKAGDFVILPDNNELLCKLTTYNSLFVSYKGLEEGMIALDQWSCNRLCGKQPRKIITIKEKEELINSWKAQKDSGTQLNVKRGKIIGARKMEYWIYNIEKFKWSKLDWEQGSKMFNEYKDGMVKTSYIKYQSEDDVLRLKELESDKAPRQLTPGYKYGIAGYTYSPDKSKIVYFAITEKKFDIMYELAGNPRYVYKTGICCTDGSGSRLFNREIIPEGYWSSDFSLFVNFVGDVYEKRLANKYNIIIFSKK